MWENTMVYFQNLEQESFKHLKKSQNDHNLDAVVFLCPHKHYLLRSGFAEHVPKSQRFISSSGYNRLSIRWNSLVRKINLFRNHPYISTTHVKTHSLFLPVNRLEYGWADQLEDGCTGLFLHGLMNEQTWTTLLEPSW